MSLSEADVAFLRSVATKVSGNLVSGINGALLKPKLAGVATKFGFADVETLVAELRRQPNKYQTCIAEALTINETSFFRDSHPFETLVNEVIPQLLEERKLKKEFTIWCGASSSGQEPYSVAMTLREHFPQLVDWSVKILATDLSEEMVKRTKDGIYSQLESQRGLPTKLLLKYFERKGNVWQVMPEIRNWIDARKMNLVDRWNIMPRCDVVLMRNVLIYFDGSTKETILKQVVKNMAADGVLLLGGGEALIGLNVPLSREVLGKTVLYRPSA